jgi:hypothetical protein
VLPLATECAPCRVRPTSDRIGFPPAFFDEVVVEQTHSHEPLLQGGVCEPNAGIESDDVRTAAVWSNRQITHIPGDLSTTCVQRIVSLALGDGKVISETSCVRLNGAWREHEIGLKL